MIKIANQMATLNGEPNEILFEYTILTQALAMNMGMAETLAAFVMGLDRAADAGKDDDGEEETE